MAIDLGVPHHQAIHRAGWNADWRMVKLMDEACW